VCGAAISGEPLGCSAFSPKTGRRPGQVMSRLWPCPQCRLIFRDSDYSVGEASQSLDTADYVMPEYEAMTLRSKAGLIDYLVRTLSRRFDVKSGQRRMIDFGCSYGHLGKAFQAVGWDVVGVDRAPGILKYHRDHGSFPVYSDLDSPQVPDESVDLVAMIDVIYYPEKPLDVLKTACRKLRRPGMVIMRVPNRNRYLRLAARLQRLTGKDYLRRVEVDHKSYWEVRTVREAARLAGFSRVRILRREHGYWYPPTRKAFHWGTQMLSHLTGGLVDFSTVFYAELWKE
jgi:SAM-dependent methyltransferase